MTNLQIHLLLTSKIINHMFKKLTNSVRNFHSDLKFFKNISEQKLHKCLPQPIYMMTDEFKVDVTDKILGCESFVEVMNLVNSLDFFTLNKEFNFLLPERRTEELNYQSPVRFLSDNSMEETDFNDTKDTDQSDDISAWQEISERWKEHLKKLTKDTDSLTEKGNSTIRFSILPEPPYPKKDVAIVNTSDLERITKLKKILDPAILSDRNDDLSPTRILLHKADPDGKLDSTQTTSHEIIFDRMKVQILSDPNSIIRLRSHKKISKVE